ncbi:luciferin 4-monooxygenase-like [Colias croceus]|uniref:luciferin 4-monooxygenase-like n=1 Tax=Colias crocea TaxID=72248 RepID=UPI001E27A059|nr:luciferin 4-monooxygenase-like [Colias croceus]
MFENALRSDFHLGHVLMKNMQQHSDLLCQIDGATGEAETFGSVLSRSIKLAKCLRNFGLKVGDVVAVGGWNHLDMSIPMYSAIFNGMISFGVSPYYKYHEIKDLFAITKPKIAFCERNFFETYKKVEQDLKLNTKIVAFGHGYKAWSEFIKKYDDDKAEGKFKRGTNSLQLSPVNAIGNYVALISLPLLGQCKLQSSILNNIDIIINMINKYKPISTYLNPHILAEVIKRKDQVDLTCFGVIAGVGEKINDQLFLEVKNCMREDSRLFENVGQTETVGHIFNYTEGCPLGSCGKSLLPCFSHKLVDPESGNEVTEPNVLGEMWIKGPCLKEYYNDPEETQKVFSEDGYFKTGDLYYRDENGFYYFGNRIKTIIKWKGCSVFPGQIEDVIRTHEGVKDVCVVGIAHPEDGERPTACVIREELSCVTAQEIKDLVIEKLSVNKELRGGVAFFKEFPMTATGKIARKTLVDIVSNTTRE